MPTNCISVKICKTGECTLASIRRRQYSADIWSKSHNVSELLIVFMHTVQLRR